MGSCVSKHKKIKASDVVVEITNKKERTTCAIDPTLKILNEIPKFRKSALVMPPDKSLHLQNPFRNQDRKKNCVIHVIHDDIPLESIPPEIIMSSPETRLRLQGNYPYFIGDYINRKGGFKLKLEFGSSPLPLRVLKKIPEMAYLVGKLKYLRVVYIDEPANAITCITLKEDLGNVRKRGGLRTKSNRKMYVRYGLLKNTKYLVLIGSGFMLRLVPPDPSAPENHYNNSGNNGEHPVAVGTYTRMINAAPHVCLEWNITMWKWENQPPKMALSKT